MKRIFLWLFINSLVLITSIHAESQLEQFDLEHGNVQVARMLSDLPNMAQYKTIDGKYVKVTPSDSIWHWVAKSYGRKINGQRIEWGGINVMKPPQYMAEHESPGKAPGCIRIRPQFRDKLGKTRYATFEELWFSCVFELINIQSATEFADFFNRASKGELSKEEWVFLNTKQEHNALLKIVAFCFEHWIPWAKNRTFRYDPLVWRSGTPADYNTWIRRYAKLPNNPYTYWGDYYDQHIVPYLAKLTEHKKAIDRQKRSHKSKAIRR